jgi:hypothetical protein
VGAGRSVRQFPAGDRRLRNGRAGRSLTTNQVHLAPGDCETVFSVATVPIKFGTGALRGTALPSGIAAPGCREADVPALAPGAFARQRPLAMAPLAVTRQGLERLYRDAQRHG